MKLPISLFLSIITIACQAQQDTAACKDGTENAIADFSEGVLGLYLPSSGATDYYQDTHDGILINEYDIEVKGTFHQSSKSQSVEYKCYNDFMEVKIREKFGADIFSNVKLKTDSLFEVGLGDRQSEFPGGPEAMLTFIHCNLDYFEITEADSTKPAFIVNLSLDSLGAIESADTRDMWWNKKLTTDLTKYREEVSRIVGLMPAWIPAIRSQKKIRSLGSFMIKFDPSEQSRCNK